MSNKERTENVFTEFLKIIEAQKSEIEKMTMPILDSQKKAEEMAKPVLEYQQKLFMETIQLQKALMENVMQTTGKILRIMSDNPMKYGGGSPMAGLGTAEDKFSEYMKNMQKIQDTWVDQVQSTAAMFKEFIKKGS